MTQEVGSSDDGANDVESNPEEQSEESEKVSSRRKALPKPAASTLEPSTSSLDSTARGSGVGLDLKVLKFRN